jgi:hypothetical protein
VRPPQVRAFSFLQSLLNLLNKHNPLQTFGRYIAVLAHLVYQASYPIPVRQYRTLQFRFLHFKGHPKPTCDLLRFGLLIRTVGLATSKRRRTHWKKTPADFWLNKFYLYFSIFY